MFGRRLKKFAVCGLVALAAAVSVSCANTKKSAPAASDNPNLTITFVDVGQGDSALIETPDKVRLLIDGGGNDAYDKHLAEFLRSRNITDIDFALASHYHSDHIGGITELLKAGRVDTLFIPEYDDINQSREKLVKTTETNSVKIVEVSQGDTIDLGDPNLKISVLHPRQGGFDLDNENSNSLVLKLEYFDEVFLFVGDLESDAESVLTAKYDLEADVLKVGHHGSSTSTSAKFLQEVDPTYAVIDVGAGNRYGHPHYEVLDALENDDVLVFRTDEDGDITFEISENGIEKISTQRGTQAYGN